MTSVTILWTAWQNGDMLLRLIFVDRGSWCFDIMQDITSLYLWCLWRISPGNFPKSLTDSSVGSQGLSRSAQTIKPNPHRTVQWLKTRNTTDTDMWLEKPKGLGELTTVTNLQLSNTWIIEFFVILSDVFFFFSSHSTVWIKLVYIKHTNSKKLN